MSKNYSKKFNEITKAKISPSRNAIISRIERTVKDEDGSKKSEAGYLIAQQMEVVEDGDVTRVFIKGASMKLHNIDCVVQLRDALTKVLEVEGVEEPKEAISKGCKNKKNHDSEGKCEFCGNDEVLDEKGKKGKKKKKKIHKEEQAVERESIPMEEDELEEEEIEEYADDVEEEEGEEMEGDVEECEEDQDSEEEEEGEYEEEEGDDDSDSEYEEEDGDWEYEDEE